jgi:hypothetical protein
MNAGRPNACHWIFSASILLRERQNTSEPRPALRDSILRCDLTQRGNRAAQESRALPPMPDSTNYPGVAEHNGSE